MFERFSLSDLNELEQEYENFKEENGFTKTTFLSMLAFLEDFIDSVDVSGLKVTFEQQQKILDMLFKQRNPYKKNGIKGEEDE